MEVTEWLTLLTASLSSLYNMFCYFAVVKAIYYGSMLVYQLNSDCILFKAICWHIRYGLSW